MYLLSFARFLTWSIERFWFFILIYFEWRDTENQQYEAWALYKSNPPRVTWGSLFSDVTYPNLASPTGNAFALGLLIVQNCFVFVVSSSKMMKASIILKIIQWNCSTIQQVLILKFAFEPEKFLGLLGNGPKTLKTIEKSSRVLCKVGQRTSWSCKVFQLFN